MRGWLLLAGVGAVVASGISPFDRRDWCLEHVPTVATAWFLVWHARRRGPLSDLAYAFLLAFTSLHALGSHYLYFRVPYAEWWQWLTASAPDAVPGRNHYDRFVHFAFGILILLPLAEVMQRHVVGPRRLIVVIAAAILSLLGTVYELIEWAIAMYMSPEAADAYNGQQGDVFDAHKDVALGLLGAAIAAPFVVAQLARTTRRTDTCPPRRSVPSS